MTIKGIGYEKEQRNLHIVSSMDIARDPQKCLCDLFPNQTDGFSAIAKSSKHSSGREGQAKIPSRSTAMNPPDFSGSSSKAERCLKGPTSNYQLKIRTATQCLIRLLHGCGRKRTGLVVHKVPLPMIAESPTRPTRLFTSPPVEVAANRQSIEGYRTNRSHFFFGL